MEHENQYCKNNYIVESKLQIQCNANQNLNDILHRNRKNKTKIHLEAQKTLNKKSNSEQKE
jgi:hypothetical protein